MPVQQKRRRPDLLKVGKMAEHHFLVLTRAFEAAVSAVCFHLLSLGSVESPNNDWQLLLSLTASS